MSEPVKLPAPNPCGSCPYRKDAPSGLWSQHEYDKLAPYDAETGDQPPSLFMCHQNDGALCAGWVGTHDMEECLAVRIGVSTGQVAEEDIDAIYEYETPVELFESGEAAAEHGMRDLETPDERTKRHAAKLERKQQRQEQR